MQMEAFVQIAYYERSSSLLTYGLLRGFLWLRRDALRSVLPVFEVWGRKPNTSLLLWRVVWRVCIVKKEDYQVGFYTLRLPDTTV